MNIKRRVNIYADLQESYEKFYSDIDKAIFDKLVKQDPTFQSDRKFGKYGKWIVNLYRKGEINESNGHIKDLLTRFEKYKNRLANKDIMSYKSLEEVESVLNEQDPSARQEQRELRNSKGDSDVEKLGETGEWEIWKPLTYAGSCTLGSGTKWCTAYSNSDHYYKQYTSNGAYLVIFINKKTGEKYQYWHNEKRDEVTLMDKKDSSVDEFDFFVKNKDLMKYVSSKHSAALKRSLELIKKVAGGVVYNGRGYETKQGEAIDKNEWEVFARHHAKEIKVKEGVTKIGIGAFYNCTSLTSIVIPNSVKEIGSYAFCNCESLTSIVIPNGVILIGSAAFQHCELLTSIVIPNSVKEIGDHAFLHCESLTSIVIPNSVKKIGISAFYNCKSLTSITLSSSVKEIGKYAFQHCKSLTSIVIPNSVKEIGDHTFFNCESLTSIVIPNSVKSIGGYAFYNCKSLKSITIPNSVELMDYGVFKYCDSLKTIYNNSKVDLEGNRKLYDIPDSTQIITNKVEAKMNRKRKVQANIRKPLIEGIQSLSKLIIEDDQMRNLQEWAINNGLEMDNEGYIELDSLGVAELQAIYSDLEKMFYEGETLFADEQSIETFNFDEKPIVASLDHTNSTYRLAEDVLQLLINLDPYEHMDSPLDDMEQLDMIYWDLEEGNTRDYINYINSFLQEGAIENSILNNSQRVLKQLKSIGQVGVSARRNPSKKNNPLLDDIYPSVDKDVQKELEKALRGSKWQLIKVAKEKLAVDGDSPVEDQLLYMYAEFADNKKNRELIEFGFRINKTSGKYAIELVASLESDNDYKKRVVVSSLKSYAVLLKVLAAKCIETLDYRGKINEE